MKVLVTGGTGFLGQHLIKKLNDKNIEVFVFQEKRKKILILILNL